MNYENLGMLTEKFVPKNTAWAMKNFTDWRDTHDLQSDDNIISGLKLF